MEKFMRILYIMCGVISELFSISMMFLLLYRNIKDKYLDITTFLAAAVFTLTAAVFILGNYMIASKQEVIYIDISKWSITKQMEDAIHKKVKQLRADKSVINEIKLNSSVSSSNCSINTALYHRAVMEIFGA